MSDPNEYIDDIVRETPSSEFQYKKDYWDDMRRMLDAQDARKRLRKIVVWSSSAAAILALIFISVLMQPEQAEFHQRDLVQADMQMPSAYVNGNISEQYASWAKELAQQVSLSHEKSETKFSSAKGYSNNSFAQGAPENTGVKSLAKHNEKSSASKKSITDKQKGNNQLAEKHKLGSPKLAMMDKQKISPLTQKIETNIVAIDHSLDLDVPKQNSSKNKHHIRIAAGANLGMLMPSGYSGLDYFAKVDYAYDFHPHWSTSVGVQYTKKSLNKEKTSVFRQYSFDRSEDRLRLNYKNLQYIQTPMAVHWNHKKHTVTAQVTPSYALGIETSYVHEREAQGSDGLKKVEEVDNNYGIQEGINRWDVQFGAGYSYALTSFMDIGGEVSMGAMDVTKDSYWSAQTNDYNVDAKVYLSFSLM